MSLGTWLGGAVGFFTFGPLGALAGAVLGSLAEQLFSAPSLSPDNDNSWETEAGQRHYSEAEQRSGFLFSLLVLAAYIVQADGRIMHSEMETVRRFLRANFGTEGEQEGEAIMHRLFDLRKHNAPNLYERYVADSCRQMALSLSYEQRLQLLSFLVEIAKADGRMEMSELSALRRVATGLGMTPDEVDSLLNLGESSLDAAYKVLEVAPTASDEEVRKAYKRLALKHHPDRVGTLGEDIRRAAERKFQELGEAKDRIYKARGMR